MLNTVSIVFVYCLFNKNLPRNGVDQMYTNGSKDRQQLFPPIPHKEIKNKRIKEDQLSEIESSLIFCLPMPNLVMLFI